MKIRPDQLAAFAAAEAEAYEDRLVDFVRRSFPSAAAAAPEALAAVVRAQIAKAEGYGLGSERQIAAYVTMALRLGVDFDTRVASLQSVLCDAQLDPAAKARSLLDHLDTLPPAERA